MVLNNVGLQAPFGPTTSVKNWPSDTDSDTSVSARRPPSATDGLETQASCFASHFLPRYASITERSSTTSRGRPEASTAP